MKKDPDLLVCLYKEPGKNRHIYHSEANEKDHYERITRDIFENRGVPKSTLGSTKSDFRKGCYFFGGVYILYIPCTTETFKNVGFTSFILFLTRFSMKTRGYISLSRATSSLSGT